MEILVKYRFLDEITIATSLFDLLSLQDAMAYPLADRVRIYAQEPDNLWDSVSYLFHIWVNVLA